MWWVRISALERLAFSGKMCANSLCENELPLYLYVVVSQTHTRIGRVIRKVTKSPFSHSSISLTADLTQMYSFARYRLQSPLKGGFVKETPDRLTLQGEEETYVHIYRIPVSQAQYRAVAHRIRRMQADEEEYVYNALAPLLAPFGREISAYKAEICSQFVAQCLRMAGVLPKRLCVKSVVLPGDLAEAFAEYLYYQGPLEQYQPAWTAASLPDDYFLRLGWRRRTTEACKSVAVLVHRVYRAHRYKA